MKTFYFLFVLGLALFTSLSRAQDGEPDKPLPDETTNYPNFYLGTSSGVNNLNGILGLNGELRAGNKVDINGGLGISSWGYRSTIGLRLYKHYPKGLYYSASFSGNSGIPEFEFDQETSTGTTETLNLKLKKVQTINLGIGGQFVFADGKFRLNLEGGYSVPFDPTPYEVISGQELTDISESILSLMSPGGIIISIGLSLGL